MFFGFVKELPSEFIRCAFVQNCKFKNNIAFSPIVIQSTPFVAMDYFHARSMFSKALLIYPHN